MFRSTFMVVALLAISILGAASSLAQETQPDQSLIAVPSSREEASKSDIDAVVGTAFTYQGQLKTAAGPVNGVCDLRFTLWDDASAGTGSSPVYKTNVSVVGGLFTVQLDFGDGYGFREARWLEIAVRCPAGSGSYTLLSPRQALTPAPIALSLPGLYTKPSATSPNVIGGYSGNVTNGVGATISGGGLPGGINRVAKDYGTIGGGNMNVVDGHTATISGGSGNTASALVATVGGGQGNTASGEAAIVSGGRNNTASGFEATVGGGRNNTADNWRATVGGGVGNKASNFDVTVSGGFYNTASGIQATVGGGKENTAGGNVATIGGGGGNTASGGWSVVCGGENNTASATWAAVAGGSLNTASGGAAAVGGGADNTASGDGSAVGGGSGNTASGEKAVVSGGRQNLSSGGVSAIGGGLDNKATDWYCTVGGGKTNSAAGFTATVGGGLRNSASGYAATIPGGADNAAPGWYSLAAGRRAKANYEGQFVFADAVDADYNPGPANSFNVRSTGGVRFTLGVNASGAGTWQCLASNGTSWSCSSDRNLKENFETVDGRAVLAQLTEMPILKWNAIGTDPSIRHLGPMAQDFYAAFGLGQDDTMISTIDLDGVALAAIQGLSAISKEQAARIRSLEAENAALQARLDSMEARLAVLEGNPARSLAGHYLPWAGLGLVAIGLIWTTCRRGVA